MSDFAQPAHKLAESGIGVAAAPTGGMGLALDDKGELPTNVVRVHDYTPIWTGATANPVLNNGTIVGRFARVGELVQVLINLTAGSTTTFGTGGYDFSLPIPARGGEIWTLSVSLSDWGVQNYIGVATINGGTTFEEILPMSNATGPAPWAPTVPFTFGSTDRIVISGMYAAA